MNCGNMRSGIRRHAAIVLAGLVACATGLTSMARDAGQAAGPLAAAATPVSEQRAFLDRYCVTCHNARMSEQGRVPLALDALDLSNLGSHPETWEKAIVKLRSGLMPPTGAPRPDQASYDRFTSWLEHELDRAAAARPNPGRRAAFHRLNRVEYKNAVRDLLALDVDVSTLLPADDVSYGFDNIAGVLRLSPTLMERYLEAAQHVARLAVGASPPFPNVDTFRLPDDLQQDTHLEGLPFGTRGGTAIRYLFPVDGEYMIRARLSRDLNENIPPYDQAQQLELSLDGQRVHIFTLPGVLDAQQSDREQRQREKEARNHADDTWDVRVQVKAGVRDVKLAFLNRTPALASTVRHPFRRPYPGGVNITDTRLGAHLRTVEISGPHHVAAGGDSPSRRRVFVCTPTTASEETGCARTIVSTLARRAYRRPVTEDDLSALMAMYDESRAEGQAFGAGIERAVRRLLVSPHFLFRLERDPENLSTGTAYRITDLELASRLSFFLWSSIPDDELLALAERGQLRNPAVLRQQVLRMVADDRAEAMARNFAGQWLFLRNLPATGPVLTAFPDFDQTLREALQRETELFFHSIVREDRNALDLLTADYSFLNERLAAHYGIKHVKGSHFRRVSLGEYPLRRGLLGHGSILTVTSYPNRTSPVLRGKWILENLLGVPVPPPPPNVDDLVPTNASGEVLSMRDRMVQHRANPACATCHSMMDPLGLALEDFDAVGRARSLSESGEAIDANGALPDGTKFEGPVGLREALLSRSERITSTITERLLTYALGRGLEHYDAPAVRKIVRDAALRDYRFSSGLILGVVESAPFQMRTAQ